LACAVCVLLVTRRAPVQLWCYFVMPVAFWAEVVHRRKVLGAAAATARASGERRGLDGREVGEGGVDAAADQIPFVSQVRARCFAGRRRRRPPWGRCRC
jgi:hypothetical protein